MRQRLVFRVGLVLSKYNWLTVLILIMVVSGCSGGGDGGGGDSSNTDSPDAVLYQQALAAYQANQFSPALGQFQRLLSEYSTSIYADNSQYYIGRCRHELKNFSAARTDYQKLFTDYPTSSYIDNAKYYLGVSYHDEAKLQLDVSLAVAAQLFDSARTEYQKLISEGTSSWADDAQYQYAKTYYDEAGGQTDFTTAMNSFDLAISSFDALINSTNPLYQASYRLDNAYYFKGRSYQQQGDLNRLDTTLGDTVVMEQKYSLARVVYSALLSQMPTSSWADNAQYRIGATYYDEATVAQDTAVMQQKLSDAILAFYNVLNDPVFQLASSADNAQYYLGRSYQQAMTIPTANRVAVSGGIDFTQVTYADARGTLMPLITETKYTGSSWIDNAYYAIGNTYYDEALTTADTASVVALFNSALSNYYRVVTDYANASNREDNAAYKMGMVYHETGYCQQEKTVLDYVLNNVANLSATLRDSINNNHIPDLNTALATQPPTPTGSHTCDITNFAGIDIQYFGG